VCQRRRFGHARGADSGQAATSANKLNARLRRRAKRETGQVSLDPINHCRMHQSGAAKETPVMFPAVKICTDRRQWTALIPCGKVNPGVGSQTKPRVALSLSPSMNTTDARLCSWLLSAREWRNIVPANL
jgi:hypothetical protein